MTDHDDIIATAKRVLRMPRCAEDFVQLLAAAVLEMAAEKGQLETAIESLRSDVLNHDDWTRDTVNEALGMIDHHLEAAIVAPANESLGAKEPEA